MAVRSEDVHKPFAWGMVIQDFDVGPYTIRSFHPRKTQGSTVSRETDTSKVEYHGYIDGKDCHESWPTLDDALAGLIVRRTLGPNHSRVAAHFVAGVRALAQPNP